MKRIICIAFALVLLLSVTATAFAGGTEGDGIRLAAHRGMSELAPENSIPAFELAGEAGYYGLEFDLQLTSDGRWVILHEEDLGRMTSGGNLISDKTFEEVRSLHINHGSNIDKYEDLRVPTLEEALEICRKYDMHPYIEVKSGGEGDREKIIASLDEYQLTGKAVIISTDKETCVWFKTNYPGITVWYVSWFSFISDAVFAAENGLDGITCNTTFFNPLILGVVKRNNLTLSFWTPDSSTDAAVFSAWGSKDFTTNNLRYDENGNVTPVLTGRDAAKAGFFRFEDLITQALAIIANIFGL